MISSKEDYQEVIDFLNKQDTRRNPHRLPLDRYSLSENEFFFTLCARQQGSPFLQHSLASVIIDSLLWRANKQGWMLFCYCLMPDHLHFIAQLPDSPMTERNSGARGIETGNILHHLADFKSYTTSQIWWKAGGSGQLWQ